MMNKRDKGITEVKIAPLILFNLSFGHVTPAFELVIRAFDETLFSNIIKLHRVVLKRFLYVSRQF